MDQAASRARVEKAVDLDDCSASNCTAKFSRAFSRQIRFSKVAEHDAARLGSLEKPKVTGVRLSQRYWISRTIFGEITTNNL